MKSVWREGAGRGTRAGHKIKKNYGLLSQGRKVLSSAKSKDQRLRIKRRRRSQLAGGGEERGEGTRAAIMKREAPRHTDSWPTGKLPWGAAYSRSGSRSQPRGRAALAAVTRDQQQNNRLKISNVGQSGSAAKRGRRRRQGQSRQ